MKCSEVLERISAYLDDETEPAVSGEISRHLDGCSTCRTEFERFSEVDEAVRGLPRYEVPAGFAARVVSTARESALTGPKPGLTEWAFGPLFATIEEFIRLFRPEAPHHTNALQEFGDVPSSFMGHAYFRILN